MSNSNEINNLKNELSKANKIIEQQKLTINELQNKLNNYNTTINNYLYKNMYSNDDGMFILDKNIKQVYDSIVKSCEELDKEIQNITGSKLIHINLTDNTEYSEDTIYYTIYLAINFDKIENIKLPENIKKEVDKKIKQLKIN
jgi:hypothetical protein